MSDQLFEFHFVQFFSLNSMRHFFREINQIMPEMCDVVRSCSFQQANIIYTKFSAENMVINYKEHNPLRTYLSSMCVSLMPATLC